MVGAFRRVGERVTHAGATGRVLKLHGDRFPFACGDLVAEAIGDGDAAERGEQPVEGHGQPSLSPGPPSPRGSSARAGERRSSRDRSG